ncbi:MAG: chromosome segregation protein SMC, partial [Candidatus Aegiribacteria sp.]|nr:chromosome segregation protein SMC [Candidatus Aegiribacteria sp.]
MYLKRLEIVGFKSFADAFEMEFQEGISCVVGPNGCGKSNVADAIRWALGSQSPTELRADRMEDIIFSGTVKRKSQGMAEVVLTFDNSQRELDLDFDEVTVTRRLFRSGDSEYLLNGNRCRLMDITDLIVDRGLGSNGYWILEKNMTDTIIESGPSDRRFLFDEAAGIVKYKMQRHRAELKLDSAGADLERLDDIISEVERNVSSLRKQVSAFRRWEKAERRITEIRCLREHRTLQESGEKLRTLENRMKLCIGREQKASAAVSASTARQSQARVALEKAQIRLDSEHAQCAIIDGEISRIHEQLAVTEERCRNTSSRIESSLRESSEEKKRAEKLRRDADELISLEVSMRNRIGDAEKNLEKASCDSEQAEKHFAESAGELEKVREEYRVISDKVQSFQKEYTDNLRGRERSKQEIELAIERKQELESAAGELENNIKEAETQLEEIRLEKVKLKAALEENSDIREDISCDISEVQSLIHSLEMEAGLLRARISGLRKAEPSSSSGHPVISSRMSVREGMGIAVGAWLDSFQDSMIWDSPSILPDGNNGERYYMNMMESGRPDIPEGAIWLPDCLEENSHSSLRNLLAGAIIAPNREKAAQWFWSGIGLDIVTIEGDLFRKDGLVRLGVPESGGGIIEREALALEAEKKALDHTSELETRRSAETKLLEKLKVYEASFEDLRRQISINEREEASLQATATGYGKRTSELHSELKAIEEKIPVLRQISREQDSVENTEKLQLSREDMNRLSATLQEIEKRRENLGAELNSLIREENSAKLELSSHETSLKQTETDRKRFQTGSSEASERSADIDERIRELRESGTALSDSIVEFKVKLENLSARREEAESSRTEASRERVDWLEKSKQADEELTLQREELSDSRFDQASVSGEMEIVRSRFEELNSKSLTLPDEGSRYWEYSNEKLANELEKQMGYRENLGPVNMLAVAEYEEARKRIEFLDEQRTDLNEARESLMSAISEINRTAARKFDETFVEVRKHFKEMFTSLFGGGEADIIALDSEDPLEGGVQIVARPPGKKLENISALSSGERAMTAAALLFAMYLVKPSPFCVLDELDAPLDDTNVDNYINLLRGFVHRTQFIVITHNKRTMEAADRLFGITMAEEGVSSMTSVSL